MWRFLSALAMAAVFVSLAIAGAILAVSFADPPRGEGKRVAVFPPWTSGETALAAIVAAGARPVRPLDLDGVWIVAFDAGEGAELLRAHALLLPGEMSIDAMMAGCAVPSPPRGARNVR